MSSFLGPLYRRSVAERVAGGSSLICTHAWYAYQSLQVRWPEAYFLASVRAPLVTNLAGKVEGVADLLRWIETSIEPRSIYPEPGRIMTGEQVIAHKKGGPSDLALLASKSSPAGEVLLAFDLQSAYHPGADRRDFPPAW